MALSTKAWAIGLTHEASSRVPARTLMKSGATGACDSTGTRQAGQKLCSTSRPLAVARMKVSATPSTATSAVLTTSVSVNADPERDWQLWQWQA
jgi:hypothetical protein